MKLYFQLPLYVVVVYTKGHFLGNWNFFLGFQIWVEELLNQFQRYVMDNYKV